MLIAVIIFSVIISKLVYNGTSTLKPQVCAIGYCYFCGLVYGFALYSTISSQMNNPSPEIFWKSILTVSEGSTLLLPVMNRSKSDRSALVIWNIIAQNRPLKYPKCSLISQLTLTDFFSSSRLIEGAEQAILLMLFKLRAEMMPYGQIFWIPKIKLSYSVWLSDRYF